MFNLFRIPHRKEISNELTSLERQITSAEIDLLTRESHVEELHERRSYLLFRLSQLNGVTNAAPARVIASTKRSSDGGDVTESVS